MHNINGSRTSTCVRTSGGDARQRDLRSLVVRTENVVRDVRAPFVQYQHVVRRNCAIRIGLGRVLHFTFHGGHGGRRTGVRTNHGEIHLRVARRTALEVDATAVRTGVRAFRRLDGEHGRCALRLEDGASVQRLHVGPVIAGGACVKAVCVCVRVGSVLIHVCVRCVYAKARTCIWAR